MASLPADLPSIYHPASRPRPAVQPGDFLFAAWGFDHGHIHQMIAELQAAGGQLVWIGDEKPENRKVAAQKYPAAPIAETYEVLLQDARLHMIATAAVPADRAGLGLRALESGKHFFSAKAPFTTLQQWSAAVEAVRRTGKKWAVNYSERLLSEAGMHAGDLIQSGAIGQVIQVVGMGPHRLGAAGRPAWFFQKHRAGGILGDIGSHQSEQFLQYTGAETGSVLHAAVANRAHPEFADFDDFGEASLSAAGASMYYRLDWLTPDGLSTWGDGRTFVIGTKGTLELRKYVDVARQKTKDNIYLVDQKGEWNFCVEGLVGYPYFGQLILDCLENTEKAMTQARVFEAARLALEAERVAVRLS